MARESKVGRRRFTEPAGGSKEAAKNWDRIFGKKPTRRCAKCGLLNVWCECGKVWL